MARTTEELLRAIDEMDIYTKDYDVISELLSRATPAFFTKVLEEVLDGVLYWSDFEQIFANTRYPDILEEQLDIQGRLESQVQKYINFRNMTMEEFNSSEETFAFVPPALATKPEKPIDDATNEEKEEYKTKLKAYNRRQFYDAEYKKIRDQLIYDITKPDANDTILTQAYKIKIYNAIKNAEFYLSLSDDAKKEYTVDTDIIKNSDKEIKYEYINPDDIFLFIHSYYIPLSFKDQQLDDYDKQFMKQYGLSEENTKKLKSISLLLRRKLKVEGGTNE